MVFRVAVIGAGAAGLAAARRLQQETQKFEYSVFEQSGVIGGTWVFDARTGKNEYGVPIHTSMYKNLRTNLPKEVMGYPDYPIKYPKDVSYIGAQDILQFLKEFAHDFNVLSSIKFNHQVIRIEPDSDRKWIVTVKDVLASVTQSLQFDAVMVCNGHYNVPNIPTIPGADTFSGIQTHSHEYREAKAFRGMRVVTIGAGPSGLDIALDISRVAKEVVLSHHLPDEINTQFPDNFFIKPDISKISQDSITFEDGSTVHADWLLYCTGYQYSFPFLTDACGVKILDNFIHPLYKHLISINHPTLCFVGLPFYVCAFSMFDLQVRFFLKTLDGGFALPSEEEMLADEDTEMAKRRSYGFSLRESHKMGPLQGEYYDDLANTADIEGLPPVMTKLHNESSRRFLEDLTNYRNDRYVLLDNENFEEI